MFNNFNTKVETNVFGTNHILNVLFQLRASLLVKQSPDVDLNQSLTDIAELKRNKSAQASTIGAKVPVEQTASLKNGKHVCNGQNQRRLEHV